MYNKEKSLNSGHKITQGIWDAIEIDHSLKFFMLMVASRLFFISHKIERVFPMVSCLMYVSNIAVSVFELHWHFYNHFQTHTFRKVWTAWSSWFWFGWVGFYDILKVVGHLMPNWLYTYILNIYDLVWLGFRTYQPL